MRDGENIKKLHRQLGEVISYIHAALYETYSLHDVTAIEKQKYHKLLATLAVLFGSIDIVLAILSVFLKPEHSQTTDSVKIFEMIALSIAVITIVIAIGSRLHKDWLKERFLAERCRSLKFRELIHPALWCADERAWDDRFIAWKDQFDLKLAKLKADDNKSLENEMEADIPNPLPPDTNGCSLDLLLIREVTEYYQEKRLTTQIEYFNTRADQFETINRTTGWIPDFCFIASVLCAGGHFGIDFFFWPTVPDLESISQILLLFTLVLPILSIGVRTLRSSVEVSHSAGLFHAKGKTLKIQNDRITEELTKNTVQWEVILKILWQCEDFFENENREWLRIMQEAEWKI